MEKKVVKNINYKTDHSKQMANNKALQKNPNDECYTPMKDIADELSHWGDKLTGKRIICPCDWDILEGEDVYSMTVEFSDKKEDDFFSPTYFVNKVEKISYSLFEDPLQSFEITQPEAEEFWKNRITCNFFRYLIKAGEQYGAKSVTASGYDPITEKGYSCLDIDYSNYDLVITNPPFSLLLTKFLPVLLKEFDKRKESENKFNFIILFPFMSLASPLVVTRFIKRDLFLGYHRHQPVYFLNNQKSFRVIVEWLTTFSDAQDEIDSKPMEKTNIKFEYYKDEYEVMENFKMKDGTTVYKMRPKTLPDDFYGWAFITVGAFDKLNWNEFEFYPTHISDKLLENKYGIKCPWLDMPNADHHTHIKKDGTIKNEFAGILVRRKKEGKNV